MRDDTYGRHRSDNRVEICGRVRGRCRLLAGCGFLRHFGVLRALHFGIVTAPTNFSLRTATSS